MTCELHGINPQNYLSDILIHLVNDHPKFDFDLLLPWNWKADPSRLKISSTDEYIEQDYPIEKLIKKFGLEGKIYLDESSSFPGNLIQSSEMAALSP